MDVPPLQLRSVGYVSSSPSPGASRGLSSASVSPASTASQAQLHLNQLQEKVRRLTGGVDDVVRKAPKARVPGDAREKSTNEPARGVMERREQKVQGRRRDTSDDGSTRERFARSGGSNRGSTPSLHLSPSSKPKGMSLASSAPSSPPRRHRPRTKSMTEEFLAAEVKALRKELHRERARRDSPYMSEDLLKQLRSKQQQHEQHLAYLQSLRKPTPTPTPTSTPTTTPALAPAPPVGLPETSPVFSHETHARGLVIAEAAKAVVGLQGGHKRGLLDVTERSRGHLRAQLEEKQQLLDRLLREDEAKRAERSEAARLRDELTQLKEQTARSQEEFSMRQTEAQAEWQLQAAKLEELEREKNHILEAERLRHKEREEEWKSHVQGREQLLEQEKMLEEKEKAQVLKQDRELRLDELIQEKVREKERARALEREKVEEATEELQRAEKLEKLEEEKREREQLHTLELEKEREEREALQERAKQPERDWERKQEEEGLECDIVQIHGEEETECEQPVQVREEEDFEEEVVVCEQSEHIAAREDKQAEEVMQPQPQWSGQVHNRWALNPVAIPSDMRDQASTRDSDSESRKQQEWESEQRKERELRWMQQERERASQEQEEHEEQFPRTLWGDISPGQEKRWPPSTRLSSASDVGTSGRASDSQSRHQQEWESEQRRERELRWMQQERERADQEQELEQSNEVNTRPQIGDLESASTVSESQEHGQHDLSEHYQALNTSPLLSPRRSLLQRAGQGDADEVTKMQLKQHFEKEKQLAEAPQPAAVGRPVKTRGRRGSQRRVFERPAPPPRSVSSDSQATSRPTSPKRVSRHKAPSAESRGSSPKARGDSPLAGSSSFAGGSPRSRRGSMDKSKDDNDMKSSRSTSHLSSRSSPRRPSRQERLDRLEALSTPRRRRESAPNVPSIAARKKAKVQSPSKKRASTPSTPPSSERALSPPLSQLSGTEKKKKLTEFKKSLREKEGDTLFNLDDLEAKYDRSKALQTLQDSAALDKWNKELMDKVRLQEESTRKEGEEYLPGTVMGWRSPPRHTSSCYKEIGELPRYTRKRVSRRRANSGLSAQDEESDASVTTSDSEDAHPRDSKRQRSSPSPGSMVLNVTFPRQDTGGVGATAPSLLPEDSHVTILGRDRGYSLTATSGNGTVRVEAEELPAAHSYKRVKGAPTHYAEGNTVLKAEEGTRTRTRTEKAPPSAEDMTEHHTRGFAALLRGGSLTAPQLVRDSISPAPVPLPIAAAPQPLLQSALSSGPPTVMKETAYRRTTSTSPYPYVPPSSSEEGTPQRKRGVQSSSRGQSVEREVQTNDSPRRSFGVQVDEEIPVDPARSVRQVAAVQEEVLSDDPLVPESPSHSDDECDIVVTIDPEELQAFSEGSGVEISGEDTLSWEMPQPNPDPRRVEDPFTAKYVKHRKAPKDKPPPATLSLASQLLSTPKKSTAEPTPGSLLKLSFSRHLGTDGQDDEDAFITQVMQSRGSHLTPVSPPYKGVQRHPTGAADLRQLGELHMQAIRDSGVDHPSGSLREAVEKRELERAVGGVFVCKSCNKDPTKHGYCTETGRPHEKQCPKCRSPPSAFKYCPVTGELHHAMMDRVERGLSVERTWEDTAGYVAHTPAEEGKDVTTESYKLNTISAAPTPTVEFEVKDDKESTKGTCAHEYSGDGMSPRSEDGPTHTDDEAEAEADDSDCVMYQSQGHGGRSEICFSRLEDGMQCTVDGVLQPVFTKMTMRRGGTVFMVEADCEVDLPTAAVHRTQVIDKLHALAKRSGVECVDESNEATPVVVPSEAAGQPLVQEVTYPDPTDGAEIKFKVADHGMQYAVEGEERPPFTHLKMTDGGRALFMPEINKQVDLPASPTARAEVVNSIRELCDVAHVEFEAPKPAHPEPVRSELSVRPEVAPAPVLPAGPASASQPSPRLVGTLKQPPPRPSKTKGSNSALTASLASRGKQGAWAVRHSTKGAGNTPPRWVAVSPDGAHVAWYTKQGDTEPRQKCSTKGVLAVRYERVGYGQYSFTLVRKDKDITFSATDRQGLLVLTTAISGCTRHTRSAGSVLWSLALRLAKKACPWNCTQCTFKNPASSVSCAMCGTKSPTLAEAAVPPSVLSSKSGMESVLSSIPDATRHRGRGRGGRLALPVTTL